MSSKLFKRFCHSFIDIAKPVAEALAKNEPVVALETTILTHGMPYPTNLKTARAVEEIVKQQGAVPATIAVVDGRVKVGLDEKSLSALASPSSNNVKISRRDFPAVLSRRLSGGTTVSGTLLVAKKVGIDVFVTGGIGGVHRDVQESMDISADLFELSQSPIMVVSSGIKSILDIGRTLEYLETLGVCVVTFSDTKDFPAFYTRKSGYQTIYNVSNAQDAADLLMVIKNLQLQSGILLGVPIPEEYSLNGHEIQNAIDNALRYCKEKGVSGKAITPFILDKVKDITCGKSLESNIALIKNNAVVGSKIAVEFKKKISSISASSKRTFSTFTDRNNFKEVPLQKKVVVVGGSMMDIVVRSHDYLEFNGGTLNGMVKPTPGGVARNVADALGKLQPNNPPTFLTAIGNDTLGEFLQKSIEHVNREFVIKSRSENTACCVVLLDEHRDCSVVIADMNIHRLITPEEIIKREKIFHDSSLVVFDGNLLLESIECLLRLCKKLKVPVWFEPTDHLIASKPLEITGSSLIHYCSPNFKEIQKMAEFITKKPVDNKTLDDSANDVVTEARDLALKVVRIIPNIMVTLGKYGLLMVTLENENEKPKATFYKAIELKRIENVSGVGDCLASGFITAMLRGFLEPQCVSVGMNAALQSLASPQTVPDTLVYQSLSTSLSAVELPLTGKVNVE